MAEDVNLEFGIGDDGEVVSGRVEYPVPFLKFKDYFSIIMQKGYYKRCIESDDNDYVEDGAKDTTLCTNDRYSDIMICRKTGSVVMFDYETRRYFMFNGVSDIVQCGEKYCNLQPVEDGCNIHVKESSDYFEGNGFIYLGVKKGYLLYGGMLVNSDSFHYGAEALEILLEGEDEETVSMLRDYFSCLSKGWDLSCYAESEPYERYKSLLRYVSSMVNTAMMRHEELTDDADISLAQVVFENGYGNGHFTEDTEIVSEEFVKYCNYATIRSDYDI